MGPARRTGGGGCRSLPLRGLSGPGAQHPALRLAGALPLWRLARGVQDLCPGFRPGGPERPGALRRAYPLLPACHLPAPGRYWLPESPGGGHGAEGQLRQSGRLRAQPVLGHQHPLSPLRGDRGQGRRGLPATQCQCPADRERILQLGAPQGGGGLAGEADPGPAAQGGGLHRGALLRRECLRPQRGGPGATPFHGGLRPLLPAGRQPPYPAPGAARHR